MTLLGIITILVLIAFSYFLVLKGYIEQVHLYKLLIASAVVGLALANINLLNKKIPKLQKDINMFAEAYKTASCFTFPLIASTLFFDKTVKSSCGAFVVLNDEGWIMTAAHLLDSEFKHPQHAKEIAEYEAQIKAIQQDPRLDAEQEREKIVRLKTNPKWVMTNSFWWGSNGVQLRDLKYSREVDLAIGRLEPFSPKAVSTYPVLKNPKSNLNPGTGFCKLGFPFNEVNTTYDEANDIFVFPRGLLPLARFPIEGIFTREVLAGKSKDGKYEIKYLETSSPGLRGQSGGPIFDVKGTVWALQSKTINLPLGFSPKIKKDGKVVEENQFLNVGWGIHPEVLVSFLKDNGIRFKLSDY